MILRMKNNEKSTKAKVNAAKRRAARAKRSKRNLEFPQKVFAQFPNLVLEESDEVAAA